MEFDFTCTGLSDMVPRSWDGHIRFISKGNPVEFEATARGSMFHILCGYHRYGNYICIPNWGIGTELSNFCDSFWNLERLTTYYPDLSIVDAISIVDAVAAIDDYK